MFERISNRISIPQLESEVMATWEENGTFAASVRQRQGRPRFVFYEGPPTPNGKPGTHHALVRAIKDLFCRYKTMEGYYVPRLAGWDTHGLPVELQTERQLGISSKREIEEQVGIENFNSACRQFVMESISDWTTFSKRLGFWLDYENGFLTCSPKYIASVWWAIRQLWDKGLIYRAFRIEPYCPRCGTALSSHEVALGRQDRQVGKSAAVFFPLASEPSISLLVWVADLWTLPGNVAVAVDQEANYVQILWRGRQVIIGELELDRFVDGKVIVRRILGKQLVGLKYSAPFQRLGESQRTIAARSPLGGTGFVHLAPAHDRAASLLCKTLDLPLHYAVDGSGLFDQEAGVLAGISFADSDDIIVSHLKGLGLLGALLDSKKEWTHCWRCDSRLLLIGLESWFIRTSPHKQQLLKHNEDTTWVPPRFKTGRMRRWLEANVDWAFSRSRYWGAPLPFWVCSSCGHCRCVASPTELGLSLDADLHRPHIDRVTLDCERCGGTLKRVPEVMDVWLDSVCFFFAQFEYPHSGSDQFEKAFPGDLMVEGVDHTRGCFYTGLVVSSFLFGQNYYRNAIVTGHVVDDAGRKASKSKGNVLDPQVVFERHGADALRWWLYTAVPIGGTYRISLDAIDVTVRKFILPFWNVFAFFSNHAWLSKFDPSQEPSGDRSNVDRWLLSRLASTAIESRHALEAFDPYRAAGPYQQLITDLSNWYVRHLRHRLNDPTNGIDAQLGMLTLYETLLTLSKLLAPFVPFIADAIHIRLTGSSVHLCEYPGVPPEWQDVYLERQMSLLREVAKQVNEARAKAGVRQRQPVGEVGVPLSGMPPDLLQLLRWEVNARNIRITESAVAVETTLTQDLVREGFARELIWQIQGEKKRCGVPITQAVVTYYRCSPDMQDAIGSNLMLILRETSSRELRPAGNDEATTTFTVDGATCAIRVVVDESALN